MQIENSVQIPEIEVPSIDEWFPDFPLVPDQAPDSPPTDSSPPEQSESESAPDQVTKADIEEVVRQAIQKSKPSLPVRLRDAIIIAVVTTIVVDHVNIDDHVVHVALKGVQVVVDGVTYFFPYLPT